MSSKQINQLPSGIANPNAVVAADNANLTVTEKITLGDIAKLATSSDVTYDNAESGLVATNVKAVLDALASGKVANGGNVASIRRLTQAEYDLIETPDENTLYVILG